MLDPQEIEPGSVRPPSRREYESPAELGLFEDERVELSHGMIIQGGFAASGGSEPEPDVAVVPHGDYRASHPTEALLIVGVAKTSLPRTVNGRRASTRKLAYPSTGLSTWLTAASRSTVSREMASTARRFATVPAKRCRCSSSVASSWTLARSSPASPHSSPNHAASHNCSTPQRFRLSQQYSEYSLLHRNPCEADHLHDHHVPWSWMRAGPNHLQTLQHGVLRVRPNAHSESGHPEPDLTRQSFRHARRATVESPAVMSATEKHESQFVSAGTPRSSAPSPTRR